MLQQFNEKNRDLLVNINGQLAHRDKAGVSPFDSAVQGGDAVWEGLRLYDGRIFKLHEHLTRLRRSAEAHSPFRRFLQTKESSKRSSGPWPPTRCATAFTSASRSRAE